MAMKRTDPFHHKLERDSMRPLQLFREMEHSNNFVGIISINLFSRNFLQHKVSKLNTEDMILTNLCIEIHGLWNVADHF